MTQLVLKAHHVGLPSLREDWDDLREFWGYLGMRCVETEITDKNYDPFGVGPRLQIYSGADLVVSYYVSTADRKQTHMHSEHGLVRCVNRAIHVAFRVSPSVLMQVRTLYAKDQETHWGHGNTSIFLIGPYDLPIEIVTNDPAFHIDD